MKFLFLLLPFTAGCTITPFEANIRMFSGVDPELQIYFDRFTKEVGYGTLNVTAGFADIGGTEDIVGECVRDIYQQEVRIDPGYWASIENDDILKEQLVFHELGHCVLWEDHILATDALGQPLSIMYPYVFDYEEGLTLAAHEAQYVRALATNHTVTF